jgi:hypothetical protein
MTRRRVEVRLTIINLQFLKLLYCVFVTSIWDDLEAIS